MKTSDRTGTVAAPLDRGSWGSNSFQEMHAEAGAGEEVQEATKCENEVRKKRLQAVAIQEQDSGLPSVLEITSLGIT